MKRFSEIGARQTKDGLGFELFNVYFGLTCNHETFRGHYDLWPFCKPYDAEEWWSFMDEDEASTAAKELRKYLQAILPKNEPPRPAPPRISFTKDANGFHLRNNGAVCGMHLFRGQDTNAPWPFGKFPDWPNHKTRDAAMKATVRFQEYLDKRTNQLAKKK